MDQLRLQDAVVFLAVAGIVIPFGKRFHVNPVLGFLLMGLVLGPYGLARFADAAPWLHHILITDVSGVRAISELGVVFLLFMIGLELSLERLWGMRRLVFGLGSAQILVTGLVIGVIAWSFGNSLAASVILGSCLALSSTAVVMQLLTEQGRFGTPVGRGSFAVLLAQDIAVVPILFVVGALGTQGEGSLAGPLAVALASAVLAVLLILFVGRLVLRPLFRLVASTGGPELFMAVTLLMIIATASATHAAGLSAALGAFVAGLLLAETEFRHEVAVNIEPFKGLLLGLFFMSVGMYIDLGEIMNDPLWLLLSVAGIFVIKFTILVVLARLYGFNLAQAVEIGLLLGQGGEFAFVVVSMAAGMALIPAGPAQFMLIVVAATMFLTPLTAHLARRLGNLLESRSGRRVNDEPDVPRGMGNHVVIAGYGRTGQLVAQLLDRQRVAYLALDLNAARVAECRTAGAPVYLGDASREQILQKLHLRQACALVVTTDDASAAEHVLRAARRIAPALPVVVRAHDSRHARRLLDSGATQVVPEVLEAGLEMGRMMLEHVGLPAEAAREIVNTMRVETDPSRPSA